MSDAKKDGIFKETYETAKRGGKKVYGAVWGNRSRGARVIIGGTAAATTGVGGYYAYRRAKRG